MQQFTVYSLGHALVAALVLLAVGIEAGPLRAFTNPLNNKALDLFIVVDESRPHMTIMNFGLLKTALNNLVLDLNPAGSTPYFAVYFYGATTNVDTSIPFPTTSAAVVKSGLDLKQYPTIQSNPSTLVSALNTVYTNAASNRRGVVPRVTLIITNNLNSDSEGIIRSLETNRDMTVIIVGIGSNVNTSIMNRLASHPSTYYAMQVGDFFQLSLLSSHISSVVSDVPRPLAINAPLNIPALSNGVYHTVQINTAPYTTNNDVIILFASGCPTCAIYSSLSEPIPTSVNSLRNTNTRPFFAYTGYPNTLSYFRVPQGTGRIFISLLGNGAASVYITSDIFSLPPLMNIEA